VTGTWTPSPRRRRRNLLLLAGLLPSLIATVVAVALLLMLHRQSAGVGAEHRGEHEAGRAQFAANRWFGTVEHWVAPYNEGVATFGTGRYDDALADFEAALDLAPPERQCLVLHNIAVTQERMGDDDATTAVAYYRSGRATLTERRCLEQSRDLSLRESSEALDDRLRTKILRTLATQEQEELARLTWLQRTRLERAEQLDLQAEAREQALREEAAGLAGQDDPASQDGPTDQHDPPSQDDPDGDGAQADPADDGTPDPEVEYGW